VGPRACYKGDQGISSGTQRARIIIWGPGAWILTQFLESRNAFKKLLDNLEIISSNMIVIEALLDM